MTAEKKIEAEARKMSLKDLADLHLEALADPRPEAKVVAEIVEKIMLERV